uniref:Phosphatidylinositol-3-phosphatase SAC1 n=1 Tax=Heterorhabditis bacteriophora TaxID=37862 RepID=A0A1I7WXX7_HETBA
MIVSFGMAIYSFIFVLYPGAGVRFYKRGVNSDGHPANFVETEQIVETHGTTDRRLTSFVQVIVNLVNQKGREKKVGAELERVAQQANLHFVRYNPFDFHKECHAMQWDRISLLKDQL